MEETINPKRTLLDIFKVVVSNGLKLLAGILTGFLLPKIIGVTDYGYYKIFTLYSTYLGLFGFGFIDGIYLKYGGKSYDELDSGKFRFFTRFFVLCELSAAIIVAVISLFALKGEYSFIFFWLSFMLLAFNLCTYYQFISQITRRFNELSIINSIHSLSTVAFLVILWIIHKKEENLLTYKSFTIYSVVVNFVLLFIYLIIYRKITFGKATSVSIKELANVCKVGIPLMVANLCSSLILSIDRQFVSFLFDTDTYAVYAFAYSMLTLITTALSSISTVIYPTMKRINTDTLNQKYGRILSALLILVFACLLVYFPLCWFVGVYLPKYTGSLVIFRIILPGLALSSCITIIMHNFYKTNGLNFQFFIKSIIVLGLSVAANFIAFNLFKTTISISVASIIVSLIWFMVIEEYFIRVFKVKNYLNYAYMAIMMASFYLITILNIWWLSMILYLISFFIFTYLFYFKRINRIIIKLVNRKKN